MIVFFAPKYSRSIVKLQLNHWRHMDYFTDVLATFLDLGPLQWHCGLWRVSKLSDSSKYLHLCWEDERRSCGFVTTLGWVINDIIFIFGWTNPLSTIPWHTKNKSKSLLRFYRFFLERQLTRFWNKPRNVVIQNCIFHTFFYFKQHLYVQNEIVPCY